MKATFEIPDELYRSAKARSALEGRSLRSVAVELFQKWLESAPSLQDASEKPASEDDLAKYPWLAFASKHVKPGASHDLDDIRRSIDRGWAEETVE